MAIRLMAKQGSYRFPPCTKRGVDGIFRAGGGGSRANLTRETKRGIFRPLGKPAVKITISHARDPRRRGDGLAGEFDWRMSSFSKPTD
jgi:hypothetical protein